MSSEISHVYYANRALSQLLSQKNIDLRRYFLGTLFPDIRYLAKIDRDQTHFSTASISNLQKLNNSFDLGMYVHVLVDQERKKVLTKAGFDKIYPKEDFLAHQASKLIEDIILYKQFTQWPRIIEYLRDPAEEELVMVGEATTKSWHQILTDYFSQEPTPEKTLKLAQSLGIKPDLLDQLKAKTKLVLANSQAMDIISAVPQQLFSSYEAN